MPDASVTISEEAIAKINAHLFANRPSLFNYGTEFVRDHADRHKVPITGPAPIMSVPASPPKVPGTNTDADYLLQITELAFDFFPQSLIADVLPPNIVSTFRENTILVKCTFWLGLEVRPRSSMRYFQLTVFFVVSATISGGNPELVLSIATNGADEGFEIVDVSPSGLEDILEMIAVTTIRDSLLQNVRANLGNLGFEIGSNPRLARVKLVPSGGTNPSIVGNVLQVNFDVQIED